MDASLSEVVKVVQVGLGLTEPEDAGVRIAVIDLDACAEASCHLPMRRLVDLDGGWQFAVLDPPGCRSGGRQEGEEERTGCGGVVVSRCVLDHGGVISFSESSFDASDRTLLAFGAMIFRSRSER
jgi:hypothetical protein